MAKSVIIVGGGAAGFFTAINIKEKHPSYEVQILEKTSKTLAKVKVSGGGRCNVTNERSKPKDLIPFYPRGQKKLYKPFEQFSTKDMRNWLEKRGVATKAEQDQRVFPASNDSQSIIDCFLSEIKRLNIKLITQCDVSKISQAEGWHIETSQGDFKCDAIVMATGSSKASWKVLDELGLKITDIVPSLFTFNIKDVRIEGLPGIVMKNSLVRIAGTKFSESGPLLITHWGMSGPAVLKLSSIAAIDLAAKKYQFSIIINLIGKSADELKKEFNKLKMTTPKKKIKNMQIEGLPSRYWENLIALLNAHHITFGDAPKNIINKIIEELTQAVFVVNGKSTFKEEFVSAGGVDLSEIDFSTMVAKRYPGLYLAGEALNIDALTGGFNFQACWTAGWLISEAV